MLDLDMVKIAAHRVTPGMVLPEEEMTARNTYHGLVRIKEYQLPIEETDSQEVNNHLKLAAHQMQAVGCRKAITAFSKDAYQILDLAPLKWRSGEDGLPIFGVFHPGNPLTGWSCRAPNTAGKVVPVVKLPASLADCYRDIEQLVEERAKEAYRSAFQHQGSRVETVEVELQAKFSGLIPIKVKEEMARALRSKLFRNLYIIAEVLKWQWNKIVTSRKGDPLVVGDDAAGQIWLITSFDTTSLEELFGSEFATKA